MYNLHTNKNKALYHVRKSRVRFGHVRNGYSLKKKIINLTLLYFAWLW